MDEVAQAGYALAVVSCTPAGLLGLPPGQAALLRHDGEGWHDVAAWPYRQGPALSRYQRSRSWPALCR